ncbi:MAG: acyl-CoA dehydrogenase family protein [Bdellovibrionota bacterium]
MSFLYSAEQEEFQDTLRKFFTDLLPSEYLHSRMARETATDDELWEAIEALGLFPHFSENSDDSGSFHDLGLIAFESGRALLSEPLVDALFANCFALNRWADKNSLTNLSNTAPMITERGLSNGELFISISPPCGDLNIKKDSISGSLRFVPGAEAADGTLTFLGKDAYFISHLDNPGGDLISTNLESSLDRVLKYYTVNLSGVSATKLSNSNLANALLCLRALELAGCAERALAMTVEFVQTRKQFGVPVGGFQAVQHKAAEMHLEVESIKQLGTFAAWSAENSPEQFEFAAKAAIAHACEKAPKVIETAIQLHGGIGFTWEYDLHLFLRRVKMISSLWKPTESQALEYLEVAKKNIR